MTAPVFTHRCGIFIIINLRARTLSQTYVQFWREAATNLIHPWSGRIVKIWGIINDKLKRLWEAYEVDNATNLFMKTYVFQNVI